MMLYRQCDDTAVYKQQARYRQQDHDEPNRSIAF